jgi:hypothetical protein
MISYRKVCGKNNEVWKVEARRNDHHYKTSQRKWLLGSLLVQDLANERMRNEDQMAAAHENTGQKPVHQSQILKHYL